jgi:hypothetical protein
MVPPGLLAQSALAAAAAASAASAYTGDTFGYDGHYVDGHDISEQLAQSSGWDVASGGVANANAVVNTVGGKDSEEFAEDDYFGCEDGDDWRAHPTRSTLGMHLADLQGEDPRKVFIARRINRMGLKSQEILAKHYSAYGEVSRVLVAPSKVKHFKSSQPRIRPGSLGFVVMANASSVDRILAAGREQAVAGCFISIGPFEQTTQPREEEARAVSVGSTSIGDTRGSGSGSGSNYMSGGSNSNGSDGSRGKASDSGSSGGRGGSCEGGGSGDSGGGDSGEDKESGGRDGGSSGGGLEGEVAESCSEEGSGNDAPSPAGVQANASAKKESSAKQSKNVATEARTK